MLLRRPRWTLWPTRSWQNKPQKRVKSEKTSCPHTGCDKITWYAGSFLSGCRTAARGRECSVILAWKPELRRKFRSDGTAQHITGDLLKYILAVGNDKSVFADHLFQLGSAAECAAWAVCPALCLPLLGLFVLLSAGTYAASGLLVGVAAGLVLHRALYTRLITHYFGVVWRVPFGLLAVLCLFVAGAAALAVPGPVKRLQAMPVTAAINEL